MDQRQLALNAVAECHADTGRRPPYARLRIVDSGDPAMRARLARRIERLSHTEDSDLRALGSGPGPCNTSRSTSSGCRSTSSASTWQPNEQPTSIALEMPHSNCHLVYPRSQRQANDAVPSFVAIAKMPSTTSLSLDAFLLTPHPPMPDFRLSRAQIDGLTAYILSLRGE